MALLQNFLFEKKSYWKDDILLLSDMYPRFQTSARPTGFVSYTGAVQKLYTHSERWGVTDIVINE